MRGIAIWNAIVTLRDSLLEWSSTLYNIFTQPLDVVVDTSMPDAGTGLASIVDWLLELFGNPSVMELMFGSFGLIIVITLVKWIIDIVT